MGQTNMSSDKALQAEINAFNKCGKLLGNADAFVKPAGYGTSFPDFAFRVLIDQKPVDIHVEYKADKKAQMGSMRDWIFDGSRFKTPSPDENKNDLIDIMNSTRECVDNGKRLLNDFQQVDKRIKTIYSGMLTAESDQKKRRSNLIAFKERTNNYQLAKISNSTMGDKIIDHYKNKFKKAVRNDAKSSLLLMMMGDELFFVERQGTVSDDLKTIGQMLCGKDIPALKNLSASLEVRIQPRGLSSEGKPVSVDVMANFRLSGQTMPGAKIK